MVAAASARASSAAVRGLDADDFRHPLDKQASLLFLSILSIYCSIARDVLSEKQISVL